MIANRMVNKEPTARERGRRRLPGARVASSRVILLAPRRGYLDQPLPQLVLFHRRGETRGEMKPNRPISPKYRH